MSSRTDRQTADSANTRRHRNARRVVIVAFDGVEAVDVSGPSSVFGRANLLHPGAYDLVHAAPARTSVTTACGLVLANLSPLASLRGRIDTILVAGGTEDALRRAIFEEGLPAWLKRRAGATRRTGSVCTGAFVLAAAGLLDGRRAVTHWASCALLQQLRPAIRVEPDAIYIVDGPICTSAGVTAGIDLALALVEADLGKDIACRIAREMVLFLRRAGGQSQYSVSLAAQSASSSSLSDLIAWMSDHPAASLAVPDLARRAGMSERSFARAFVRDTGQTPAAFVRELRVETARRWLETTSWPVKRIAQRAGFGSEDSLLRAFHAMLGVAPATVRARFGAHPN